MARAVRGGLYRLYKEESERAEAAGLSTLLTELKQKPAGMPWPRRLSSSGDAAKKVVHHEIEGIDVLEIDNAVRHLLSLGIYCQPAMGCTGPIVLVASEDAAAAAEHLKRAHFLS